MILSALIIFQEEFEKRNLIDWMISHVSGSLPPHRYKGHAELTGWSIKFMGIDTLLNVETDILIDRSSITEVFHGYDEIYTIFQTRGLGLTWAPVRVKYTADDLQEKAVYFITGYDHGETTNKEFYAMLVQWLS